MLHRVADQSVAAPDDAVVPSTATPPGALRLPRAWELALVALLVIAGTVLRARYLDHPPMTIDEAESAVNALTILRDGVPTSEYLGLPLFENTLTRPWPDHPEYEFRDTSYSDAGYAVYHGWLPLYSIAASFGIAGIRPDAAPATGEPLKVNYSTEQMSARAIAARAPSLVFGAVFLLAAYGAGKAMYGADAGWIGLILATFAEPSFEMARTARYYAATVALATLACWMIWNLLRRGAWRDYLAGAVVLGFLFHTHSLTFLVATIVLACCVPWLRRRPGAWRKLGALGAIVVAAVLPWMIWTGFLDHTSNIPPARSLLSFPTDYLAYVRVYPAFAAILAAAALVLVIGFVRRDPSFRSAREGEAPAEPQRSLAPEIPARREPRPPMTWPLAPIALLGGWMVVGYLAFVLLIPAASFFLYRLTYSIMGPMLLLAAILCAAAGRIVLGRYSMVAPVLVLVGMTGVAARGGLFAKPPPLEHSSIYGTIEYLRTLAIEPGTRIYALPYEHLPLTFYTGLPVQSIAPVRRSFLDTYNGPILILETVNRYPLLTAKSIREAAGAERQEISPETARAYQDRFNTIARREDLVDHVAQIEPMMDEPVPSFVRAAIAQQRAAAARPDPGRPEPFWGNPAIFRGFDVPTRWGFWSVFFYRFVDPASRRGENVNYAGRIRGARAVVLPWEWVVYHCPPLSSSSSPSPASDNPR